MGSGKTYWGARLATMLHVRFIDLDQFIETQAGATIPEIFERSGADYFRALERDCLRRLPGDADILVATGGGTPCYFDNMDWMNARGLTVYLETDAATLAARLAPEASGRPLLARRGDVPLETFIRDLLREREPCYRQAAVILPFQADPDVYSKQLLQALASFFEN